MPHRFENRRRRSALLIAWLAVCGVAQAQPGGPGGGAIAMLEDALTGVIERCERSVVSIVRTNQAPAAFAQRQNLARGVIIGGGGAGQIVFPGQARFGGGLNGLEPAPNVRAISGGAGVVIDSAERLILTQYRVVKLGDTHVVTDIEGDRYLAEIRAADPRSGLAVLEVQSRFPIEAGGTSRPITLTALPLGQAERLRKGNLVVAIGNPYSIESDGQPTASWGSVTNTARKAPAAENLNDSPLSDGSYRTTLHHFGSLIQTDARLGWNAGGGALVNLKGELVGVTTTAAVIAGHEQPAGYAIPINAAMRRAIASMRDGVEPEYGLLGVKFSTGAARSKRTGAIGIAVNDAFRGGPAQRGGLQTNDLLLSVAGEAVTTPEALQLVVGSLPPGEAVTVAYERAGRRNETEVILGKAFIDQGQIVSRRRPTWRGIRVDFATAIPPDVLGSRADAGYLDEEGCVAVTEVEEGSVSWESGVRPYNFISHVSGQRVTSPEEFYRAVSEARDNVKLKFTKPLAARAGELN